MRTRAHNEADAAAGSVGAGRDASELCVASPAAARGTRRRGADCVSTRFSSAGKGRTDSRLTPPHADREYIFSAPLRPTLESRLRPLPMPSGLSDGCVLRCVHRTAQSRAENWPCRGIRFRYRWKGCSEPRSPELLAAAGDQASGCELRGLEQLDYGAIRPAGVGLAQRTRCEPPSLTAESYFVSTRGPNALFRANHDQNHKPCVVIGATPVLHSAHADAAPPSRDHRDTAGQGGAGRAARPARRHTHRAGGARHPRRAPEGRAAPGRARRHGVSATAIG